MTLQFDVGSNKYSAKHVHSKNPWRKSREKFPDILNFSQPGGGQVKIETRKLEWKAVTKTEANNDKYLEKKVGGEREGHNTANTHIFWCLKSHACLTKKHFLIYQNELPAPAMLLDRENIISSC